MKTIKQLIRQRLYGGIIRKINTAIMVRLIECRIMRDRCIVGGYEWKYYQSKINILNDILSDINDIL